jgi:S-DNA-T family DNA segregation ATPase FtsK/SpoIIIE
LVIIVIDELAMLSSYSTDRDLLGRAGTALRSLLALGRAPGFVVYGNLKPSVEPVLRPPAPGTGGGRHGPLRGGRRGWRGVSQDPRSTPGIGYVPAENGDVTRVRVAHVPDDMIRALAAHFPASVQIPVTVPVADDSTPPRTRAPRASRESRESRSS